MFPLNINSLAISIFDLVLGFGTTASLPPYPIANSSIFAYIATICLFIYLN